MTLITQTPIPTTRNVSNNSLSLRYAVEFTLTNVGDGALYMIIWIDILFPKRLPPIDNWLILDSGIPTNSKVIGKISLAYVFLKKHSSILNLNLSKWFYWTDYQDGKIWSLKVSKFFSSLFNLLHLGNDSHNLNYNLVTVDC